MPITVKAVNEIVEERKRIADEAGKKAVEEQLLKLREKDDLIKAMQGQR